MAFNVTSNYSGKAFGQYISAALKEAKSLEGLTVLEIQAKEAANEIEEIAKEIERFATDLA